MPPDLIRGSDIGWGERGIAHRIRAMKGPSDLSLVALQPRKGEVKCGWSYGGFQGAIWMQLLLDISRRTL